MTFKPSGITHATIVGRVVAPAEDKLNGAVTELRVAVGHGFSSKDGGPYRETGTTWLTYSASGDYANPLRAFGKGDLIEIVDAALSSREYETRDGEKRTTVEARYGTATLLERKGERNDTPSGSFDDADTGGGF